MCSSFDFAGILVRQNLVDTNVLFDYWAPPIRRLVRCIADFLSGILLSLLGATPIKWSYKDASNRIKPAFESSDTLH